MSKSTFYTIGHSTRTGQEFLGLLKRHRIQVLVDVRRYPASRRHPQFSQSILVHTLEAEGIEYIHEVDLGGRRRPAKDSPNTGWDSASFRGYADYMATREFQEALTRLEHYGQTGATAIMCAEAVPWRCHRQLIADALLAHGHVVKDILGLEPPSARHMTSFARVSADGHVWYPPDQEELPLRE